MERNFGNFNVKSNCEQTLKIKTNFDSENKLAKLLINYFENQVKMKSAKI